MILATQHPTAWSWIALAGIAVLLGLGGLALIRLNDRERTAATAARARVLAVPAELRFHAPPVWQRLGPIVPALGAALVADLALGPPAAAAAFSVGVVPFSVLTMRRQAMQRRTVITTVRARSSSMSAAELTDLIEGLETAYGRREMQPLRGLLPSD